MMPIDERVSYGVCSALCLVLGYIATAFMLVNGYMLIELAMNSDAFDEDLPFPVAFMISAILMLVFGAVVGLGALLGALLIPIVATTKLYWYGFGAAGMLIAGCTLLFLIFDIYIEANSFLLTLIAGFVLAIAMRILGLTFGWARHWTPPGACESCGYDLRETPLGGNCPECGAAVGKAFVV